MYHLVLGSGQRQCQYGALSLIVRLIGNTPLRLVDIRGAYYEYRVGTLPFSVPGVIDALYKSCLVLFVKYLDPLRLPRPSFRPHTPMGAVLLSAPYVENSPVRGSGRLYRPCVWDYQTLTRTLTCKFTFTSIPGELPAARILQYQSHSLVHARPNLTLAHVHSLLPTSRTLPRPHHDLRLS